MPEPEHMGKGGSLHDAAQEAYKEARGKGHNPPFVVTRIELHGANPFTEYRLFISPQ